MYLRNGLPQMHASYCRAYHKLLSEPKEILLVDFQEIVNGQSSLHNLLKPLQIISLPATKSGSCNALICWFEVSSP